MGGMEQHVRGDIHQLSAPLRCGRQGTPHRREHFLQSIVSLGLRDLRRGSPGAGRRARFIDERQDHAHQGDSVRAAMMDASDESRTFLVPVKQVKLKKRPCCIERRARQIAHEVLQLLFACRIGRAPRLTWTVRAKCGSSSQ